MKSARVCASVLGDDIVLKPFTESGGISTKKRDFYSDFANQGVTYDAESADDLGLD
jgi:hypothetical protein